VVIVSLGLPFKNECILSSKNWDSLDMNNSLTQSLTTKDNTPFDAQELAGPKFITSIDIKK
jgi:hypothetical protein